MATPHSSITDQISDPIKLTTPLLHLELGSKLDDSCQSTVLHLGLWYQSPALCSRRKVTPPRARYQTPSHGQLTCNHLSFAHLPRWVFHMSVLGREISLEFAALLVQVLGLHEQTTR